jgi:uncharacterized protein
VASELGAYLDSSAIVKLIAEEPETAALRAVVKDRAWLASSELALTEVTRAVHRTRIGRRRAEQEGLERALEAVLGQLDLVVLDRPALQAAGALPGAWMRTLDAIHVVAALEVSEGIDVFVTYDERQAEAAAAHALPVASPGVEDGVRDGRRARSGRA